MKLNEMGLKLKMRSQVHVNKKCAIGSSIVNIYFFFTFFSLSVIAITINIAKIINFIIYMITITIVSSCEVVMATIISLSLQPLSLSL